MSQDPRKVRKPRTVEKFRLFVVVMTADGLMVIIEARHRTKEDLRVDWNKAKLYVARGTILGAEAWDKSKGEQLAQSYNQTTALRMDPPFVVDQPTNKPLKKKKETKKNVVQQDNTRRKPGKRPRT